MTASRRLASLPLLLAGLAPLAWMPRALRPHAGPGAVPSARPAPFLHTARFALLAMALGGALLWSAPAEAQTATVLVSNTGQTSLMTPWALNSTIPKRAQAFTTGAHTAGYTVSSIGISFAGISDPSTAGDQLIVTLNANGNGNPGDALCTLGDPASFTGSGVHTFAAPATCPTLTASTTYFAVIERVVSTATISLDLAFNLSEDTGAAAGWSIADVRHFLKDGSWGTGTKATISGGPYRIAVRGALVPFPVLIKNTGQSDDGTVRRLTSGNPKRAQAFTTGSNSAGYTLYAIAFDFDDIGAITTAGSHLAVTLNEDSGGDPGTALCTLIDPASFSASGVHTFDAPATDRCPTLAASTTYFAVIDRVQVTPDVISLEVTTSSNEDSGGATGWSIGDDRHFFSNGSWFTSYTQTVQAHLVVVNGVARVNNLATGAPTITGTPRVGEELTADTSAIADDDGLGTFVHQWVRVDGMDDTNVGTDSSTYTVAEADLGKQIRVDVTFDDDADNAEGPLSSVPTGAVVAADHLVGNTGQTADAVGALSSSTTKRAQGFTTGSKVEGYALTSVGVSFHTIDSVSTAASQLTATINEVSGSGPGDVVCTLGHPGGTYVNAAVNTYDASNCPTLDARTSYFFVLDRTTVDANSLGLDRTASTSEDTGAADGWSIADSSHLFGSGSWSSAASPLRIEIRGANANSPATGAPSIQGFLEDGEELTADTVGIADADGLGAFSYQWLAGGTAISGATSSTYELTSAEVGDAISLTVTFTDDEGFSESLTSAATYAAVASGATHKLLWLGTMEVGSVPGEDLFGYTGGGALAWDHGSLSVTELSVAGVEYTVGSVVNETGTSDLELSIYLSPAFPGPFTLHIGSVDTEFASQDASEGDVAGYQLYSWSNTNLGWSDGQKVTIFLQEKPGVILTPSTLTVAEGGTADYTVELSSEPTADVTVDITGGGDLTVNHNSLTFTSATWDTAKTVTVTAAQDDDGADDAQSVTHAVASGSADEYLGATLDGLAVTVTDDEIPGVTLTPTTLTVAEGGTADYTVKLSFQPTADVTVDITGGGDVTVNPTSLTFSSATWNTAQTVTVTAAQDDDGADDTLTVGHAVDSSSAAEYLGATLDGLAVTVTDDESLGITLSPTTLTVAEGGTADYTVKLSFQPTADVTVDITGGGDVTVNPTSLTFSSVTWNTAQTVTVTAAQDDDGADDTLTVGHAVDSSSAAEYLGATLDGLAVTVDDDESLGITLSPTTLTVNEGGTADYTVELSVQPTADVTVDITGGGDVTVNPTSLTFSSVTWDTAQTVTVTAAQDTDAADDAQTVGHAVASSSASEYVGATLDGLAVTVDDDEDPAVTVSFEQGSYTVAEGGSVTVKVQLSTNPEREVVVLLTTTNQGGASSGDYSGVPASVTFQSSDTEQSFTFTAAQDTVVDGGESVKLGFGSLPAKVTAGTTKEVTVSISQAPTVSATADPGTVFGGGTVTLDGTASDPDGDALTFAWTSDGGGSFAPAPSSLDAAWIAPATETAHTVNLTLTATDEHGLSASVTVSVLVEPAPQPNAATDLRGTVGDDNLVSLTWTLPGQPTGATIANVLVQQRMSGGAFSIPTWDTIATLPASATAHAVGELGANRTFYFRIRLTTTLGASADSRYIRVRTLRGAPAPRHFAASWPTQTSITLDWSTVETAAAYRLEYRKDGETEWNRISGDFDHLPSTTDHRQAFGVAAGLDCNTRYDFRLSARGSGETRNDGNRYPSTHFGSYATTSAQTGECAQEERVTNLLVSVEPGCAILTWTPPSGDRDTGYRVERYNYTGRDTDEWQRTPQETLVEEPNRVANRYEDCSAEYRTDGAEHEYIVTALDNNPGPDEEGAFGTAYTSILVYGPSREPEGPLNVRLTHDTQSSRRLAWDAPRDPWLTTVKTARAGSGPQQVVTDPWTTGYRVERHEYRRAEDGGWFLPEFVDETLLTATMTVGEDSSVSQRGYSPDINGPYGELTQTVFTLSSGSYTVIGLYHPTDGGSLRLTISPRPPSDAPEDWILVIDGISLPLEDGIIGPDGSLLLVTWFGQSLSWAVGQQVSAQLVERSDWKALRYGAVDDTGTSFTDSEDKGDRQYVYRVWAYNNRGLSRYSWRGDWAFNGGDPGGDPEPAGYVPPPPAQQQGGEAPSNTPATGAPAISGTPQVEETLTVDTSGIGDADGMTNPVFTYRWVAGGVDIQDETDASYIIAEDDVGLTIQVWVSFTDDNGNPEVLTSVATAAVLATVPTVPLSLTVATGDQIQELDASWQAPSSNGGSAVTSYKVQWKEAADSWDTAADVSEATETGTTHTVTGLTGGVEYAVRVIATNDVGDGPASTEAKGTPAGGVSEQTVDPENTAPTGLPTISGTPRVEQTLTADTSPIDDEDGLTNVSYRYQWIAGGSDIEGATGSSYELTSSEQGQTIQVRVSFTDDRNNAETLTSVATVAVAAAPNREATGAPTIGGTPQVGQTLTVGTSAIDDEDGLTNVSYRYQWIADGTDIEGATGSSYELTSSEQGQTIQVRVSFTDDRNNAETLTSVATVAVAAAPVPLTVRLKVAAPTTHDGSSEFTFEIEFSEEFGLSYVTLKSHAFNATGGSVERAQRTDKPSNIPWRITVKPHGTGDVTIELPATTDCNAEGAICTADGRMLSNSLNFTVSGPGQ